MLLEIYALKSEKEKKRRVQPVVFAEKANMYSLGVLLFAMYFGGVPFQVERDERMGHGDEAMFDAFLNENLLTRGKLVSQRLKKILMGLLVEDPMSRLTIEQCLDEGRWIVPF